VSTLTRAIVIAAEAHEHQKDKAGAPYILHPLRVMLGVRTEAERIAAVLHDVVEDTPWTLAELAAEGFAPEVLAAVEALTKREGESRPDALARAAANPIARRVKLADLTDNLDPSRIAEPTARDHERLAWYARAKAELEALERTA
jgi:(p)ppGpp synthase/HD superfamily hydrolase